MLERLHLQGKLKKMKKELTSLCFTWNACGLRVRSQHVHATESELFSHNLRPHPCCVPPPPPIHINTHTDSHTCPCLSLCHLLYLFYSFSSPWVFIFPFHSSVCLFLSRYRRHWSRGGAGSVRQEETIRLFLFCCL